jgi:hypothetical protein
MLSGGFSAIGDITGNPVGLVMARESALASATRQLLYTAIYEESTIMVILDDVRLITVEYKARHLLFFSRLTKHHDSTIRQVARISTPN